ncbi:MAG: transporter substrate-binding domain-containing protein [Psychromonas sp.]
MSVFQRKLNSMFFIVLCTIFIFLLKVTAAQAIAQPKQIDVASAPWVNGVRADGTGLYLDILRLVYEPLGIEVKNNITDYAHSVSLVKHGDKDAWLGSYLNEEEGVIYPKWHFDADVVTAVYKKSSNLVWRGTKSLAGKNVGWIKGYNYHKYFDEKFNIKEFTTRESAIKSLQNGQLDFFLEASNELNNEFIKHPVDPTMFTSRTLMNLNIFLGFANNERGKLLADLFDMRFATLLESGEIKKLYNKWNWPMYPYTKFCTYADTAMINC